MSANPNLTPPPPREPDQPPDQARGEGSDETEDVA